MKKLRFTLILLCFCMLLPIAACGKEPVKEDTGNKYVYDDLTRETAADSIPEGYDLEGQTIGIFYPLAQEKFVLGDAETTDVIFSKIHERNLSVEERLNVDIDFIDSGVEGWEDSSNVLKTEIQTMSSAWEAVFASNNMVIQKKLFNYFHNLNDSNYIDADERWWYSDAIYELSVDNYNYRFLYGDICAQTLGQTGAIYYNKDMYEQYLSPTKDRDELYQKVLDGTWTIDEFDRLTKKAHIERGGDGSNDIYGWSLFGSGEKIYFFQIASGINMYHRDNVGMPVIDFKDDKSVDFVNKLYSIIYENEGSWPFFPGLGSGPREDHKYDFPNGKVMFLVKYVNAALDDEMREMKTDFGILPFPKWDEAQDSYYSLLHNSTVMTAIPVSTDEDRLNEEVSAVIEALASEAYRHVAVAYYETALKTTYNRDDMSAQMIDIICGQHDTVKSSLTKNFIYEYSWCLGGIGTIMNRLMSNKSTNFVSTYDSLIGSAEQGLKDLIKQYKDGKI